MAHGESIPQQPVDITTKVEKSAQDSVTLAVRRKPMRWQVQLPNLLWKGTGLLGWNILTLKRCVMPLRRPQGQSSSCKL
eukprot:2284381-Amphidinium_carterae.1